MKSNAILINTARSDVVDEEALLKAIRGGWIASAVLGVLAEVPLSQGSSLLELPNFVCTPHLGGTTRDPDMYVLKWWLFCQHSAGRARTKNLLNVVNNS